MHRTERPHGGTHVVEKIEFDANVITESSVDFQLVRFDRLPRTKYQRPHAVRCQRKLTHVERIHVPVEPLRGTQETGDIIPHDNGYEVAAADKSVQTNIMDSVR